MSVTDELERLADLHRRGVLSDDEFARAKARTLDGGGIHGATGTATPPSGTPSVNVINAHGAAAPAISWIGGVGGGIAQITGLASWVWRLMFIFGAVFAGSGLLLYVLMWILVPEESSTLRGPSDELRAG